MYILSAISAAELMADCLSPDYKQSLASPSSTIKKKRITYHITTRSILLIKQLSGLGHSKSDKLVLIHTTIAASTVATAATGEHLQSLHSSAGTNGVGIVVLVGVTRSVHGLVGISRLLLVEVIAGGLAVLEEVQCSAEQGLVLAAVVFLCVRDSAAVVVVIVVGRVVVGRGVAIAGGRVAIARGGVAIAGGVVVVVAVASTTVGFLTAAVVSLALVLVLVAVATARSTVGVVVVVSVASATVGFLTAAVVTLALVLVVVVVLALVLVTVALVGTALVRVAVTTAGSAVGVVVVVIVVVVTAGEVLVVVVVAAAGTAAAATATAVLLVIAVRHGWSR